MRTAALATTPVFLVWQSDAMFWDKARPAESKLLALIPGRTYWLMADAECQVGEGSNKVTLKAYEYSKVEWPFPPLPRCNPVKVSGGAHLTEQGIRDVGLNAIEIMGLAPIFNLARVSEIRVLDEAGMMALGYSAQDGGGQIVAERVVLLKDNAWLFFPEGMLAASILHECIHLLTRDAGLYNGFNKDEMRAYMVSQVVHWLKGEAVDVFKPQPNPPYPTAAKLMQLPWPGTIA